MVGSDRFQSVRLRSLDHQPTSVRKSARPTASNYARIAAGRCAVLQPISVHLRPTFAAILSVHAAYISLPYALSRFKYTR